MVNAPAGPYVAGQTYEILPATMGVTGTFDAVLDNNLLVDFELVYSADLVQLRVIAAMNFRALATTRNQQSVAGSVDSCAIGATDDTLAVIAALFQAADIPNALDQLAGDIHASLESTSLQSNMYFQQRLANRWRQLQTEWVGSYPQANRVPGRSRGGEMWFTGIGTGAELETNGNATGLTYATSGGLLGGDRQLSDALLVGFAAGYGSVNVNNTVNADALVDDVLLGTYGMFQFGPAYLAGSASYGRHEYDTSRRLIFGGLNRTAAADYTGEAIAAQLEAGRTFNLLPLQIQPIAGVQYVNLDVDNLRETGADSIDLVVNRHAAHSLRSLAGLRAAAQLFSPSGALVVVPELHAFWLHEFADDNREVTMRFADCADTFAIRGLNLGRDTGILGAGATMYLSPTAAVYINYDQYASDGQMQHTGSGGLRVVW